ncbi:hypothetical protein PENNAL_c0071G05603 [Penicillium nalgiovense]|uniref:Uncharacterized protein n=1 Tax=Penicillium nalgiovense TaxID=60175 RepID=A0A1V6XKG3_PENNA|nr:hypothetical protein PENNAL_c0071G05603 [Penicillium nalgiovense]
MATTNFEVREITTKDEFARLNETLVHHLPRRGPNTNKSRAVTTSTPSKNQLGESQMAVNEYSTTRIPSPMAHNQYLVSGTLPDPSAPSTPPTLRLSSCIRHSAGSGGLMRFAEQVCLALTCTYLFACYKSFLHFINFSMAVGGNSAGVTNSTHLADAPFYGCVDTGQIAVLFVT